MLTQTTFPDCRLLYKTEDSYITIDLHMAMLSKSAYFDALFRWKESTPVKVNMIYLNQYTVDIPFDHILMDLCIKMIYNISIFDEFKKLDVGLYSDLLDIVDFLQLDNTFYKNIIECFLELIDENEKVAFNIVQAVCNSNIDTNKKKMFVARTFYLLTDEEKSSIDKEYINKYLYHGKSFIDDKGRIIVADVGSINYNGIKFSTHSYYVREDNYTTFILEGHKLEKFNMIAQVYDGINVYIKKARQQFYHDSYSVFIDDADTNIFNRYEFILEPKEE